MSRLARALEVFELLKRATDEPTRDRLLAAHSDIADLLVPMLAGDGAVLADAPARLGEFELLREIGRGGMGVVFEARQVSLDRRVAIKLLAAERDRSPQAVARFRREAQTIAQLEHAGIVRVLAVGEERGRHWFAMELVDGKPPAPGLPVAEAVRIVVQVADALDHAHRAGVVHRDVKPSNILVRADGRAVLTDFGLSLTRDLPSMTRSGALLGTPDYLSPEQARGEDVDARSDVFSLGATLFELVTGKRPFAADSPHAIVHAILTREAPDPRRVAQDLPEDLAAILTKALEKERDARYASASAFASDLRAFLAFRPVTARRPGLAQRVRRWAKREPAKATLAALLAVCLPVALWLSGYLLGHAQDLSTGIRERQRDAVAERIATAFVRSVGNENLATAHDLERELAGQAEAPELWTMIGVLYIVERAFDGAQGFVERNAARIGSQATCARLRAWILACTGGEAEAASIRATLGAPQIATELEVEATRGIDEFRLNGDRDALAEAALQLRRAANLAARPSIMTWSRRASAAATLGDTKALAECVEALRARWPDSVLTLHWRAVAARVPDPKLAVQLFEQVLARAPEFVTARAALGGLLAQLGELDRAKEQLERTLAATPRDDAALGMLGLVYYQRHEPEEARDALERAIALAPGIWEHQYHLGMVHNHFDRARKALPPLSRAAKLNPKEPEIWHQLAIAYAVLDRYDDARAALETVLVLRPDDADAVRQLDKLPLAEHASRPTSR